MHLGEATSNWMRATMRIAWLLLSLGLLLHSVRPVTSDTSETTGTAKVTAVPLKAESSAAPTAAAPATPATAATAAAPATPATAAASAASAASAAPAAPATAAAPATPATATASAASAAPAAPATTAAPGTTTAPATTTASVAPTAPATTAASTTQAAPATNDASAASAAPATNDASTTQAAPATNDTPAAPATPATTAAPAAPATTAANTIVQTPEASVLSKMSETESSVTQTGNPNHTKTTITKASTDATAGQQPMTHISITSKTNGGDADKTTVTVTRGGQTASGALEPTGIPVTTSNPTTLTKASNHVPTDLTKTMSLKTTTSTTITEPQLKRLQFSLNSKHEKDHNRELVEVCKRLMVNLQDGNCTLTWRQLAAGKVQFDSVEINGNVKTSLATHFYEEISKKKATDNRTLIAILASCGALLIMIVILAVCASHHRKPYNENQQHLTEELHTVENGYHDNPTLEVMEVQPEMQEKKMVLNGEFNDSWIVPIDNLLKEDIPDEEDTHL